MVNAESRQQSRPRTFIVPRTRPFTVPGEWELLRHHFAGHHPVPEETTREWEEAVAAQLGVTGAACVNSGRQGLALIIENLRLKVGDEVIVPAYTLLDLVPLIERYGAKVVPADVDPGSMMLDPARVAERITARTRAIVAWHAFGTAAAMGPLCDLAAAHDIAIIEDCAHALGGTLSGKPLGTFGHAAFLSFEAGRPVNTYGGGMVVSNDAGLIAHVRHINNRNPLNLDRLQLKINTLIREQHLLRSGLGLPLLYGFSKPLSRRMINRIAARQAAPSEHNRYAPVQALLGLKKLPHVEENCARRAEVAKHYDAALPASVLPQARPEGASCTHAMYVVRCPQAAERIRTQLLWRGIDAGVGNEIAHDVARPLGYGDCPHAARLAQNALALPIFEDLTEPLMDRVVDVLRRALER